MIGRSALVRLGMLALLAPALSGCGGPSAWHLLIHQTTDAPAGDDHKSHLAPGAFAGLTLTIRNLGPGAARGITIQDVLPQGFHFYELTTLGGDAIRTSIQDPGLKGDPIWGTWTLPPETSDRQSTLVISFKMQASTKPGEFANAVKLHGSTEGDIDPGDPVVFVVEPRPSLVVTTAATAPQASTGGVVTYILSIANVGSAIARGVTVSVTLPPGFLYTSTAGYEGNSARTETVDPPASSLLPVWAAWAVPGTRGDTPGLLRIHFQARILPGVQPGLYSITAAVTGENDIPAQVVSDQAPVAVGKGTTIPISMRVAPTGPYASRNGSVTYVITVENDSVDAASTVIVTDTLPQGFTYQGTNSIAINGKAAGSRLQPSTGSVTPRWGPFTIPAGGFNGATLVITFTAHIAPDAALGPHPNVVSGTSINAQITGGADQSPVTVTAS